MADPPLSTVAHDAQSIFARPKEAVTIGNYTYDSEVDEDSDFDIENEIDEYDSFEYYPSSLDSDLYLENSDSDACSSRMDQSSIDEINGLFTATDGTKWFADIQSDSVDINPEIILPSTTDYSSKAESISDFFSLFFTGEVYQCVLKMTNDKMDRYLKAKPQNVLKNKYLFTISFSEMKAFIGLMILSGAFRASREPLSDLFSEDLNFGRPIFRATMPRERFKVILRFLRFDDIETRPERQKSDNLAPIRVIFDKINFSFVSAYSPGKFVTIDEHLCRWRGRCKFRQYMPNKPDKYGLKCWILADSRTFYPITVEVYTGKNVVFSNKPEDVTLRLVSVLPPWHVLVGDNYFTSLHLVRCLFNDFHLYYIGTVGKRRRFVPKSANIVKGVDLYSSTFYYSEKNTLVSYIRKKAKNVLLLSNYHRSGEISIESQKKKPQIILDYNFHKAGVDKLDQMLKEFRPYRATRRWTLVLFFDLIALATQAAWVLYCIKYPNEHIVKLKQRKTFLYKLGTQLVEELVISRMNSPSFRYLATDIKQQILSIANTDNQPNHSCKNVIDTAPVPRPDNSFSIQLEPPNCSNLEPIESELPIASISYEGGLNDDQIDESSKQHSAKIHASRSKVGRCHFCDRNKDKKTRKKCDSCLAFVCPLHAKNIVLCEHCSEKMSLV